MPMLLFSFLGWVCVCIVRVGFCFLVVVLVLVCSGFRVFWHFCVLCCSVQFLHFGGDLQRSAV